MKHTPGDWRLETWSYSDGKRLVPTIQTDKDAIAQVLDLWPPDERAEEAAANGRLLTAAPKMLAALQKASTLMDNYTELIATSTDDEGEGYLTDWKEVVEECDAAIQLALHGEDKT